MRHQRNAASGSSEAGRVLVAALETTGNAVGGRDR